MPEQRSALQPLPQTAETPVVNEALETHAASNEAYGRFLDYASSSLMEVSVNRQTIEAAGQQLIATYDLAPTLFEDPGRSILFVSAANRWSKADKDPAESAFLEDALTLLAHEHSPKLKQVYDYVKSENYQPTDEHAQAVYDKYTNHQVTAELRQAIADGLLDDAKARLGITPENEDAYEVRVLSIGEEMTSYGVEAPDVPDMSQQDFDDPEKRAQFEEASELWDAVNEWKKGLEMRRAAFHQDLDGNIDSKPAWVTHIKGKTILCVQQATIEKIIHPDVTAHSEHYTDLDRELDLANLEHEYAHTQGGVNLGGQSIDFGIGLEELRAEAFSGNRQGYMDLKSFAADMGIVTGTHLAEYFEGKVKGGDSLGTYEEIARSVGLDRMLEVIMVRPSAYDLARSNSNLLNHTAAEFLGGFDSILARIIEDRLDAGKAAEIDENISKRAQQLVDVAGPDILPTYFSLRRECGNVLMTDLIEDKINKQQAQEISQKAAV